MLLALADPALADKPAAPAAAADRADRIDVSEYRDKMVVATDGRGHHVIVVPESKHYTTVLYGNGKTFYLQRTFGGSMDGGNKTMSARFWDPRVNHQADVVVDQKEMYVQCGTRKTTVTPLAADEQKKLLEQAEFLDAPWKYEAYQLARDDRGTYYYVDRLRSRYGGKGFRLWIGPRGNMKLTKLINIVSDSEGDIFATRSGELRLISAKNSSTWIKGKKRKELVNVPAVDNVKLIYAELGVYLGDLGTPCDHL